MPETTVPMARVLWDSTAFDNEYSDHKALWLSIKDNGQWTDGPATPIVMSLGDFYLVVVGRKIAMESARLGNPELKCFVVPYDEDKLRRLRIRDTFWAGNHREGRNYHVFREGM